jgi:3-oxoacyl-[acyl-carrier protein] reductase
MYDFSNQTILVTGAGSGIGRSHASYFAAHGATVIAHDIDTDRLSDTLARICAEGGKAIPFGCDLRDGEQFASGIERLEQQAGPIDVLVNNAGIMGDGVLEQAGIDLFDDVFGVNLGGTFFATQAVISGMKARRAGRIVLTSSTWGMVGQSGSSIYAASKAALLGLTKAWAREFAPWGIGVNCVAPGGVATDLLVTSPQRLSAMPLNRHAEPDEVSHLVGFLASTASSFMTGAVVALSGGEVIVGC